MIRASSPSEDRRAARNVVLLTVVFLGCLWGVSVYWAVESYRETVVASERSLAQMTHAVEQYVSNLLKMAEVFQTTAERWVDASAPSDPRTDAGFIALIEDFRQRTNGLIDIRMATTQGDLYYFPAEPGRPRDNVADREYFQAVIQAPPGTQYVGIPVVSRVSGQWRLPITMRMQRVQHGLAVINASVNLSELIRTFESERPKPHGSISFWRADGTLLARAPQSNARIGKPDAAGWGDWAQISTRPGGAIVSRNTPYDGTTRLISHQRLRDKPLVVAVTATLDDILAAWRKQTLMVFLGLLLVSAGGILFAARLLRALRQLSLHALEQERLAITDPLTGLVNRRHLFETGMQEMARARRYDQPMALLLLDIDYFKRVNDTWGHPVGDGVLKGLAARMVASVRNQDAVGRLGGEEFAVILPETDLHGGGLLAERMRTSVEETPILTTDDGQAVSITVSIGIAALRPDDVSFETLLSRADKGLYRAKEAGRNRIGCDAGTQPVA